MVTLQELSEHLASQGMPSSIVGSPATQLSAVNTLEDATPDELSFLANPRYEKALATTRAGAVIVRPQTEVPKPIPLLRTADPYAALMQSIVFMHGHRRHPVWGIHASAAIHPTATIGPGADIGPHTTIEAEVVIGEGVRIYPGCYIGRGCRLGRGVTLYPNVVLYEDTVVGNNVAIHAGTVIGEDGLGYAPVGSKWMKIPHVGHVVVEDDVEIGANCTIDRATLGTTFIGRGSKFSNLIAIGHNSKVGENAMFVAQVGLAGSVTVGKHVQMGGQAGVAGHVTIGDDAIIAAKAGVTSDVEAGLFVLGQPAIKASDAKRSLLLIEKLPDFKQRLRALEARIAELEAR